MQGVDTADVGIDTNVGRVGYARGRGETDKGHDMSGALDALLNAPLNSIKGCYALLNTRADEAMRDSGKHVSLATEARRHRVPRERGERSPGST